MKSYLNSQACLQSKKAQQLVTTVATQEECLVAKDDCDFRKDSQCDAGEYCGPKTDCFDCDNKKVYTTMSGLYQQWRLVL